MALSNGIAVPSDGEGVRKRKIPMDNVTAFTTEIDDFLKTTNLDDDSAGCQSPSTPEEECFINEKVENILQVNGHAVEGKMETDVQKPWTWKHWTWQHFHELPDWLQDNDYIHYYYRPELPSIKVCFRSILRIHNETVNIWSHLLGCVAFLSIGIYFLNSPNLTALQDKSIFSLFFTGAIVCLGFSFTFHTLSCHSPLMARIFSKLDYCGIAIFTSASAVPWLYYSFYCHHALRFIYVSMVGILGLSATCVSLFDRFATPEWRSFRAGVFVTFGVSGIVPALHFAYLEGFSSETTVMYIGWLALQGLMYVLGAMIYALRVPERFFPGKFDLWFHSHQILHMFVLAAASIHCHGLSEIAMHRMNVGECHVISDMVF